MRKIPDSPSQLAAFFARHSAIVALAVFAIVGVLVLDDYGIASDAGIQRTIGQASLDYILGDENALMDDFHRYYGVALEVPLIAVERVFGLEDSRDIFLARHLITHLVFLSGGFFAWLLAYRLFGSRLVAPLAMLIFLLHPRLYAHSFFNSRDLPFLSGFMIALYLILRAFRRDTAWAFALCGAGVGLLANVRVMGLALVPAVLGMLALDAFRAMRRGGGVKRILANMCAFSAMCAASLYASWPLLWRDPLNLTEALETLSRHPLQASTLFRGEIVRHPNLPWDFVPTWILITTPPVALILAALGTAYLARLCAADWRDALANQTARFGLLALACLILPVAAVIALNSNMFNGWRHTYFLYAPLCVLAAFGLRALAALPKPRVRAAAFGIAALGIAVVAAQMVRLHPFQSEYFSPLVARDGIADRWDMMYWKNTLHKEALDALLEIKPTGRVAVSAFRIHNMRNRSLIPRDDRRRIFINRDFPSFRIEHRYGGENVLWEREIYGVPAVSLVDVHAESKAAFEDAYAAAKASGPPAASAGGFDIYRNGGALAYINETGGDEDPDARLDLSVIPLRAGEDGADGVESRIWDFWRHVATFDGKTLILFRLPDYPVRAVETAMRTAGEEGALWSVTADFYAAALSEPPSERAASAGGFDIYRKGGELIYVKRQCAEGDARGRFFLSVFPADPSDIPQSARDAGREHQALNFDFDRYGATVDGGCVIIRRLPDYPISRVETGQWIPGEGELWKARIEVSG